MPINKFAKSYAETLAEAGLACVVWDIYSGLPLVTDYDSCIARARQLKDADVVAKVGRWIDHMLGDMGLKKVGVLGFCIGGRFAIMQAATDKRIGACAMAYPFDRKSAAAKPGHGFARYGGRDRVPGDQYAAGQ